MASLKAREILAQSARKVATKNNDQTMLKQVEKVEAEIKAIRDREDNDNVSRFDTRKGIH